MLKKKVGKGCSTSLLGQFILLDPCKSKTSQTLAWLCLNIFELEKSLDYSGKGQKLVPVQDIRIMEGMMKVLISIKLKCFGYPCLLV